MSLALVMLLSSASVWWFCTPAVTHHSPALHRLRLLVPAGKTASGTPSPTAPPRASRDFRQPITMILPTPTPQPIARGRLSGSDAPEDVPSKADPHERRLDQPHLEHTFTWVGTRFLSNVCAARSAYVTPVGADSFVISGSLQVPIPASASDIVARLRIGTPPHPVTQIGCP